MKDLRTVQQKRLDCKGDNYKCAAMAIKQTDATFQASRDLTKKFSSKHILKS